MFPSCERNYGRRNISLMLVICPWTPLFNIDTIKPVLFCCQRRKRFSNLVKICYNVHVHTRIIRRMSSFSQLGIASKRYTFQHILVIPWLDRAIKITERIFLPKKKKKTEVPHGTCFQNSFDLFCVPWCKLKLICILLISLF